MNLKRIIILALVITIPLSGIYYFINHKTEVNKVDKTFFIKNTTWWTNSNDSIPFKKNDNLDLTFIFESTFWNIANIDLSKLENKINIKEIYINDELKNKTDLKNIKFKDVVKLKIIWDAQENSQENENLKDLINITIEWEKEEETQSWEILDKTKTVEIFSFNSHFFSSNIWNILEISWTNLELIDYVIIWEKKLNWVLKDNKFYVRLDSNSFWAWDFFVGFYLKNGKLTSTDKKIIFSYNPNPINIVAITPNKISNKKDSYVVIQWNWFAKMISLQLSNNYIFKNALFNIINDKVATVKIPAWLVSWTYYFNIMDVKWIYKAEDIKLEITN